MVRVSDSNDEKPGKPRVYEILIENLVSSRGNWKSTYSHTIRNEGWEEFNEKFGDL
jgi:hypothetical protein